MNTPATGEIRPITIHPEFLSAVVQRFEQLNNGYAEFSARVSGPLEVDGANQVSVASEETAKLQWATLCLSDSITELALALRPQSLVAAEEPANDAVDDFSRQILEQDTERQTVTAAGIPALQRLASIADCDTGQAATVRQFLLCLYNGYRFPFNLVTLRGLDKDLFDDCMAVLALDARATALEIHCYLDDGDACFQRWAQGGAL